MKFTHCPLIEVGDIFTRKDRNGKIWTAEVTNRTEYFVDVKKNQPYQIKVGDEYGCYHYEDAPDTFERCMIYRDWLEEEDGTFREGLFGGKIPNKKIVYTDKYFIEVKEDFSRSWKFDKTYILIKPDPNYKLTMTVDEALKEFHKYCEEE